MEDCIFCKIIRKEIPAKIVYEDENALAFLDVMPRSKGMCIVVPKKHYTDPSDDFETSSKIFDAALIVAEKIKKSLNPLGVFLSVIQTQIPHFHIRVYPVYQDQIPLFENRPQQTTEEELNSLAQKIKNENVEWKGRKEKIVEKIIEKEVEKQPEKEEENEQNNKENDFWLKRAEEMG